MEKNGPEKTTKMYFNVVLRTIPHKESTKGDFARFNTSQRLAEQAKMILRKDWFSDLEILEICR